MRKDTSTIASGNSNSNYAVKKQSLLDQFRIWFRDFLENAE